jgi:hypothetical protein
MIVSIPCAAPFRGSGVPRDADRGTAQAALNGPLRDVLRQQVSLVERRMPFRSPKPVYLHAP